MSFLIGAFLVTIIALIPIGLSLWQRTVATRETYDSTAEVYKSQLDSLEKDLKANLIDQQEYDSTRIEIQRRLLNSSPPPPPVSASEGKAQKLILISTMVLTPMLAIWLYAEKGVPSFSPKKPDHQWSEKNFSPQLAQIRQLGKEAAKLSPMDKRYSLVHEQLGDLKAQIGLAQPALEEWKLALKGHFTPELALKTAEAETQLTGHVSPEALKLYHQALDAAPPDAPWRLAVETRIATGEHDKDQKQ
ncbi:c-type cytochrome biogenesis protein CcmI [Acetobacteraceae bacterium ESL0709]|nr:c-type cytochrome biogenesis protein CcmI [Acetobacteraceae bacterium ESL0697]MDF7677562.1 c-type cytochrome biogenesis protein CcmI [Acetobacteraceae bacterium ESL0709]